ncbi:MFS transporter [Streptomyces sp. NPDC008238]
MSEQCTAQDRDTVRALRADGRPGGHGAARAVPASRSSRKGVLPPRAAFYLLASIVVSFLAGSSAPTPLYAVYQAEWGFGPVTTTLVFGVYAIAVLVSLLTLGRLSDHLGRRPVLLAALTAQAAAMVVFATAHGVPELRSAGSSRDSRQGPRWARSVPG